MGVAHVYFILAVNRHMCVNTQHTVANPLGGGGRARGPWPPPPILLTTTFLAPLAPNKTFFSKLFASLRLSILFL